MPTVNDQQIEQIRQFNRFYTRLMGLLNEGLFKSQYNLMEARIIYELGEVDHLVASQLGQMLSVDAGYLSRVLNKLTKAGIITRMPNNQDKRQSLLSLSAIGEAARIDLRQRSIEQTGQLYNDINPAQSSELVAAMAKIQHIIAPPEKTQKPYILREPEVGDLAYIAHRQSVLYDLEYGFGNGYEAVVSQVVADYIDDYDQAIEKCWIAECDDKIIGSIFCVNGGDGVAKLRLLYVDPVARGMGLGSSLIEQVIKFARIKKYKKIEFWTVDCLDAALHLYKKTGFEHISSQPYADFGGHLNAGNGINRQDWQMIL
ncbi:MAG: bifunctional helix-turn-helix transcriptional regulator/GNAT family N-acetyltransferase [Alphaproteobacteria bacterium]|nr:bifunctional helix-turn-helix transcriptional regulator/GNAT family N-acetyltransferase [Alphaproteobacteria bacterium]